jgi:carboxyl-terminal processing protease
MYRIRVTIAGLLIWLLGAAAAPATAEPLAGVAQVAAAQAVAAQAAAQPSEAERAQKAQVFDAVCLAIEQEYYDEKFNGVDIAASRKEFRDRVEAARDERALYRAINEMLARFRDRHLYAASPSEVAEERRRVRTGLGMGVSQIEGRIVVTEVQPASAAAEAGVKRGWVLTHWDGEPVSAKVVEAKRSARSPEGHASRLRFLDARDKVVEVTATARPYARFPESVARLIEGDVLYVRFDLFGPKTGRWLRQQVEKHRHARALVVDLRRNVGGAVDSLRESLEAIFAEDQIVGDFKARGGRNQRFRVRGRGSRAFAGPVAVLIGAESGSAAEIFASVVQEANRGTVVGRTSAGAVLASIERRLPDGGTLYLSIRDYVSARGRRLEGQGVAPSIAVALTLEDLRSGRDRDLESALEVLPKAKPAPVEARGADGRF